MEKLFAEYLPAEGDIKPGVWFIDNWAINKNPRQCKHFGKVNGFVGDIITDTNNLYSDPKNCKKVKFVLCSRDIEKGDKLRCYRPDMSEWIEVEFIQEINGLVDGNMVCTYQCKYPDGDVGGALKENFFKVLGDISPEAKWVMRGMEFDEEDIRNASYKGDMVVDQSNCSEEEWKEFSSRKFPDINGFQICYMVKGPCGHFH